MPQTCYLYLEPDELNSGNITLGFTFGLVVLGRNGGDIGEILKETKNPVFDPADDKSIKIALNTSLNLAQDNPWVEK